MTSRPNIVVVICHDLGRSLGCYGAKDARTEHIDSFAMSAIRFENSFCAAPQCSPSRAALWTGRYPHANGVVGLAHAGFMNDLNPSERHLAQILAETGYETHLFGVQHEARSPERCGYTHVHPRSLCGEVAADFEHFLAEKGDSDSPLFAQIGFIEPHRPFPHEGVATLDPDILHVPPYLPDIPEVREDLATFEASVASVDRAFARILKAIEAAGMVENTVVVFTADHGIPFSRAKMTLYDPGIEIPLIVRLPGEPGSRTIPEMISNVDFVPTILDMLGLEAPANLQGRSFWELLAGEETTPRQAVFAEKTYHTYYDPMRAIRTERWKLIANFDFAPWQETPPDYENNAKSYAEVALALNLSHEKRYHPPYELYDLMADPWEQRNLADSPEHQEIRDDLARRLRRWMQDTQDPLLDGPMAQGAYRQRMAAFKQI